MRLLVTGLAMMASVAAAQETSSGPAMVFFDWGKGEIRSDDVATLDKVAESWRAQPSRRILLTGHTDRSGTMAVNRASGLKRVAKVRDELQKRGIPRNAMRISSFGEERPLVPTEDGVREVQNRRVEIGFEE